MIPAMDETRAGRLYQNINVMLSVMSPSITLNQEVLLQLRFDKPQKRIRRVSPITWRISDNCLLFLSHPSTNEDSEEGDADGGRSFCFFLQGEIKTGVEKELSRSTVLPIVCVCVCV